MPWILWRCPIIVVLFALLAACGSNDHRSAADRRAPLTKSGTVTSPVPTPATSPAPHHPAPSSAAPGSVRSTAKPGAIPPLRDGPTGPAHSDPAHPAQAGVPVRVRIPSIHVDARLQRLGLNKDGTLETPSRWQIPGWYADGVRPGDNGPALIAGHIDSVNGPAIFWHLKDLERGADVYVSDKDGSVVHFVVAKRAEYPKKRFPTEAVYGPTPEPTLRLVTCTGDFDYRARSYLDNLVVTAYLDDRHHEQH